MDTENRILKLQLITLFDSISFGLIYAFLAPYLMVLGGDNVTTGMLAVSILICQLLSDNIAKNLIQSYGKRDALFTMFSIATLSHVLLVLTGSCWFAILARCLFTLTYQSNNIIKDLLMRKVSEEEAEYHAKIHSILSSSGYIIGPVVTGCLFDVGFSLSCILAAILTLFNACLTLAIAKEADDVSSEVPEESIAKQTVKQVSKTVTLFKKSDYEKNWDLIALKFMYISSVTIFFTKFPQILKYNFNSDAAVIGYTTSFFNTVVFIADHFKVTLKDKYEHIPTIYLIHQALLISFFSFLVACYIPYYTIFAIACIPVIVAKSFINTTWNELYSGRRNDSLNGLNDHVGIAVGLTVPILFGITCNSIHHHAVISFSLVPMLLSLYILNTYTCIFTVAEVRDKSKDE
ncbi:hypothetical protein JTB14_023330 [Gonioctena quinquepunctata]|nr:hypothetical protein JTB14_023330 [Gonioctena quinquepunctata]